MPAVWATQSGGTLELVSTTPVGLNEWHYVLLTFDRSGGRLFLDGQSVARHDGGTVVASGDGFILQGGAATGPESFQGLIDELILGTQALDEGRVAALYAQYTSQNSAAGTLAGLEPSFGRIPELQVQAGQTLVVKVPVFDPDYDLESLGSENLPSGATLDVTTRNLLWTPSLNQVGRYSSVLVATDRKGHVARQNISWNVFPGASIPPTNLFEFTIPSPIAPETQPRLINLVSGATEGVGREGVRVVVEHATNPAAILRVVGLRGEQVYKGSFGPLPLLPVGHYFLETPGDRGHLLVLPKTYNGSSFMGAMGDSPDDRESQLRTALFRPTWRRLGTHINWADIEKTKGLYDWTQLDRWVAANRTNGGKIVMILVDELPTWLRGSSEATFLAEFTRYARDYVRRNRDKFDILEPFNEPMLIPVKQGGIQGVSTADYHFGAQVLARAYAAVAAVIRAELGNTVALAGPTWSGMVSPHERMQSTMGSAGLANSVNVGDYHDYEMGRRQPDGPSQGVYYNVRRSVEMLRANTGQAPFIISELGLHGVSALGYRSDPVVSVIEPYGVSGLSWGLGFRRTLVSTILYHGGGATSVLPHDFVLSYGLEICGREPALGGKGRGFKPQITAFVMACHWLDRAVRVTQMIRQEKLHVYSVQRPGNESLVFAWVPETQIMGMDAGRVTALLQSGEVKSHDIFGREFIPSAFGEEPILFRSSTLSPAVLAERVAALENASCNGVIEAPGEECDCTNLGGATSESLGYGRGTLRCSPTNTFDFSGSEFSHPKTLLTAHYPFDDLSGTSPLDVSGRKIPSLLMTPYLSTSWVSSTRGRVLHFEGVTASVPRELLIISNRSYQVLPPQGGSFAISLWLKLGSRSPTNWMSIMTCDRYGLSGFRLAILNSGQLCWWTTQGGGNITLLSPSEVSPGVWHHVAICYQPSGARLYVDGKLAASSGNTVYIPTAADILIGHAIGGGGVDPYRGELDDLRFYSRALTASEVGRIAASTP